MNMKSIITFILALIVLGGAWLLLSGSNSAPLTKLTPLEPSKIQANATLTPEQPVAGEKTKLTFTITDATGTPAALMVHHGRRVHVVIISKDLATLGHIHPQDFSSDMAPELKSGVYSVDYAFPEAGKYIVAVDVMTDTDYLSQEFLVNVTGSPAMGSVKEDFTLSKCFKGYQQEAPDEYTKPYFVSDMEVACPDGYKVTLTPGSSKIVAGAETLLRFHVEKNGKPVTDLTPYLSAPIHFAIVPESLDFVLHRHGSVDETLDTGSDMKTDNGDVMSMDTSGIHIMADGSVMLANGKTVTGAKVTAAGMVQMPDGTMVKPAMDLRANGSSSDHGDMAMAMSSGGSMGDSMDSMSGMMHHDDEVPAFFGPDIISEPIVFPKPGVYRIFAQVKHGTELIPTDFMVRVEQGTAGTGVQKTFDLTVTGRKIVSGSPTLTVNQGDTVTINITDTDEGEELHLHGYDKMAEFKKGEKATITFVASASGRFPFELENSKTDLGALEVLPQ